MNLIKCNNCGRPFYDSEKACPFCGHASNLSSNNRVTKTISDPRSHKLMEAFFNGEKLQPETPPIQSTPVVNPEPAQEPEPIVEPEPLIEPEPLQPSDAVLDRADSIAAAVNANANNDSEEIIGENPNDELETTLPHKKRRWWIWVIILVILLGLAAAVYLKWDFVYGKISSLIG